VLVCSVTQSAQGTTDRIHDGHVLVQGVTGELTDSATDQPTSLLRWQQQVVRISSMLRSNCKDEGLMNAAGRFSAQLERIKTPSQLYAFMTATNQHSIHRQRKIRVQPTSVARRRPSSTSGSSRHRAGRPLQSLAGRVQRPVKRPHFLSTAVQDNRPNAKSHGDSH
jgi:hypothetical protein